MIGLQHLQLQGHRQTVFDPRSGDGSELTAFRHGADTSAEPAEVRHLGIAVCCIQPQLIAPLHDFAARPGTIRPTNADQR